MQRINSAAIPEAFFTVVQPSIIIIGDKNIPPPTPNSPEIRPIMAPIIRANGRFNFFRSSEGLRYCLTIKSIAEIINNIPAPNLNNSRFTFKYPPINAKGMEVIASGKLTTYSGQSRYQLSIDKIEPAGSGALMQMLIQRKMRLEQEGLEQDGNGRARQEARRQGKSKTPARTKARRREWN